MQTIRATSYKKLRVFNQRLNKRLSGGRSGDISKGYISEYPSTGECRRDCEIAIVRSAIVDDDAAIFPALSSVEIQSTTKEQVQPAIDRTSFDRRVEDKSYTLLPVSSHKRHYLSYNMYTHM